MRAHGAVRGRQAVERENPPRLPLARLAQTAMFETCFVVARHCLRAGNGATRPPIASRSNVSSRALNGRVKTGLKDPKLNGLAALSELLTKE